MYRSMTSGKGMIRGTKGLGLFQGAGVTTSYATTLYDTSSLAPTSTTAAIQDLQNQLNTASQATTASAETEEDKKKKMMIIGGIGAAVVIAGVVVVMAAKKK